MGSPLLEYNPGDLFRPLLEPLGVYQLSPVLAWALGSQLAATLAGAAVVYPHLLVGMVWEYPNLKLHPLYLHRLVGAFHLEQFRHLVVLIRLLRLRSLLRFLLGL